MIQVRWNVVLPFYSLLFSSKTVQRDLTVLTIHVVSGHVIEHQLALHFSLLSLPLASWARPEEHPDGAGVELAGHSAWMTGLAFAPDGGTLASCSVDGTVKLWEVASGRCLQTLTGHTNPVFAVAWSPDGQLLASSGQGCILLWDIK